MENNIYQMKLIAELGKHNKGFQIKTMKEFEDNIDRTFATQVKQLTDEKMSYGNFEIEEGHLINKEKKLIIILPEEKLFELQLFKNIKKEYKFDTENINFIIKKSEGDINYLVRENNEKGSIELDGRKYKVFEEKPSSYGDATNVLLLKTEKPTIKNKRSNSKKFN